MTTPRIGQPRRGVDLEILDDMIDMAVERSGFFEIFTRADGTFWTGGVSCYVIRCSGAFEFVFALPGI